MVAGMLNRSPEAAELSRALLARISEPLTLEELGEDLLGSRSRAPKQECRWSRSSGSQRWSVGTRLNRM